MTALSLFELNILAWFRSLQTPIGNGIAIFLDAIAAHGEIFILLTLLLLLCKPTRKAGLVCATAMILNLLLVNVTLKPLIQRPRPFDLDPTIQLILTAPHDFSFPSGHTSVCFAFAAAISMLGKKTHTVFLVLACIMGLSRLYLSVHYPTDVLAGALCGTLCGIAAIELWKKRLSS